MASLFQSICDVIHGIEDYHDALTKSHECRVGKLMGLLSTALGLNEEKCTVIEEVGTIHDVGKIAIPAAIIEKIEPLTTCERKIIELHPIIGHDLIKKINHPKTKLASKVILTHHENFDGSGYPNNLKGDQIPIEGAICAICDVYDALREKRPYRGQLSHAEVFDMMYDKSEAGLYHKFNPEIMSTFKSIAEEAKALYT
jgi:putative two-component system response regulator